MKSAPPLVLRTSEVTDRAVQLAWQMTERDFAEAQAWVSLPGRRLAGAGLALFLGALLATTATQTGPGQLAGLVASVVLAITAIWALWWRPRVTIRRLIRGSPEGFPVGPQHLEASRSGVVHTIGRSQHLLSWTSIQRIALARQHVFIHLSGVQVVTIPRRAFGSESSERRALGTLRAWHERADIASTPEPTDPGLDDFVLSYLLTREDFVRFGVAVQRAQLRMHPVLTLGGLGLFALVLVLGGPFADGSVEPVHLVKFAGLAGVLALLGVGPLWIPFVVTPIAMRWALHRDPARLPSGDVDLRVGPAGGWSRSSRGSSRFGWSDASAVLEAPGLVAILFGPVTGVIVPDRALGDRRDEFVARCRAWIARGEVVVVGESEGAGGLAAARAVPKAQANVYAPPNEG